MTYYFNDEQCKNSILIYNFASWFFSTCHQPKYVEDTVTVKNDIVHTFLGLYYVKVHVKEETNAFRSKVKLYYNVLRNPKGASLRVCNYIRSYKFK